MSSLIRLAAANVLRQRGRTGAALAAIALGVASIILSGGFIRDIFDQLAEAVISSETGHIQVAKQGFFDNGSRSPERFVLEDADAVARRIEAQPGVAGVLGRLKFSGLLSNRRSELPVIGEGIEPAKEARLGTYLKLLQGSRLEDGDRFGMMVGEGVAQSLRLSPGSPASLLVSTTAGAVNAYDVDVVAVTQSFSREYDARSVKVTLSAAQELLATRGANLLVVSVDRTADAPAIAGQLRARLGPLGLEVRLWNEINDFYDKAAELYRRQFGILQLIVLLMVVLSVVNSVSGAIYERTAEFGTMRALGNRSRDVFAQILAEGSLLGLAGSALGLVVGVAAAAAVSQIGIPMPAPPNSNLPYVARIQVDLSLVLQAAAIGLAASVLATVPAALRAGSIPIVEALRSADL